MGGILAAASLLTVTPALAEAPSLAWKLVASYPHDREDFTQGLLWENGRLFESAGQYGASHIAEKELRSGRSLNRKTLPASEFAEGLAFIKGQLWQLTWREGVAHIYDLALTQTGSIPYGGEGWGMTSNSQELIVSDGSAQLYFVNPETFAVKRSVAVQDESTAVFQLNELEWVEGAVYANVWKSNRIAKIDPVKGRVMAWLDLSPLEAMTGITPLQKQAGAVLNGIAWRSDNGHLLVTGKYWPKLFEIKLISATGK